MEVVNLKTDILIIGGGAAGCYAEIIGKKHQPDRKKRLFSRRNLPLQ